MSNRPLIAMALATTALIVGGCGSSSKSSSQKTPEGQAVGSGKTTPAAQTQPGPVMGPAARLISSADLICARLNARRASNRIASTADYIRVTAELSSHEREAIAEMVKFTPPASLATPWKQMLANYRTLAANIATISHEIATKHGAVSKLVTASIALQKRTATIARRAGFKDCGQIPRP
jgi:hypothetical protein